MFFFLFEGSVTDDYHLRVCVGDKDCIECNNFPSKNSLQWADSTCPEGTQGDTVRIVQDNDVSHLSLCEVKITGKRTYPVLFSYRTQKYHFWCLDANYPLISLKNPFDSDSNLRVVYRFSLLGIEDKVMNYSFKSLLEVPSTKTFGGVYHVTNEGVIVASGIVAIDAAEKHSEGLW